MKEAVYTYEDCHLNSKVPNEYKWNVAVINALLLVSVPVFFVWGLFVIWFFIPAGLSIVAFGLHAGLRDFEIVGKRESTWVPHLESKNVKKNNAYQKAVDDCVEAIRLGAYDRDYWSNVFSSMNSEISRFEQEAKEKRIKELPTADYLSELKLSHELYMKGHR